jgi:ABC-type branched-subunit amino acid transport system permease subunit
VSLGTLVFLVLLLQGLQFLPHIPSAPGLTEDLGWILLGSFTIAFVWFRPQGVLPERRPRYLPSAARRSLLRRRAR